MKPFSKIKSILIANRGEIAIRIARAASECGLRTVAIFSEDDQPSLHTRRVDEARPLRGGGPAAYLEIDEIIALALEATCDAIHPGYGFLSENAEFARRCAKSGLIFVGPKLSLLELFGNKVQARALAQRMGIPILAGTSEPTSLEQAKSFLASLGPQGSVMVKAVAGGGGRGMRTASTPVELEHAYSQCSSEALAAFGNGDLYVEQLLLRARHIEVQIAGDGQHVIHLGERECSIQRRNQKFVEISPALDLPGLRDRVVDAAMRLARETCFDSVGTFEFLVDASHSAAFFFLEANPRLQVEHTITEEITTVDLVKAQLGLAEGRSLKELGLEQSSVHFRPGFAMELRINAEQLDSQGQAKPSHGIIESCDLPAGPGIRVDTAAYTGFRINPRFDPLLAKLVVYSPSSDFEDLLVRARRALSEFRVRGITTNIALLERLLQHPDFRSGCLYTRFVEDHIAELAGDGTTEDKTSEPAGDNQDPTARSGPEGTIPVTAAMQATVVSIDVNEGDRVAEGQPIAVLEAMKMHHVVTTTASGIVRQVNIRPGDMVFNGHALIFIEPAAVEGDKKHEDIQVDLDQVRPDLAEVMERHAVGSDERRPEAVARRRKTGQRTARENIADLCDPGSFTEYGALAIAAQRRRRSLDDLIKNTPGDGLLAGVGTVNDALFPQNSSCCVMAYDYTVLAGTQGTLNHKKMDHMIRLAEELRLPVVIFAEGGGGRPGDTDGLAGAHLDVITFYKFARLSGRKPLIGIVSGRCFAGNAALLGCCDVIIATQNSSIGMAGPAMIEGGGLGVYDPEDVGPIQVQTKNGVVDIAVRDEAEAVRAAKKYLSFYQGRLQTWEAADQRLLRTLIPENRLRIYDIRKVIEALVDTGWFLELRRDWAPGMITALIRIQGWPLGLIANNPAHLAGAIDPEGADKASRFMQLCEAYALPILSLCDTPGFMVGPEIEKKAQVRHTSRMFLTGANLTVPYVMVTLRKGYGLGAQAMAGGCFSTPTLHVSWPTGEFGPMGLEGAVKLGYRKELEAIQDPQERQQFFEQMVARAYENGKAINVASFLELDDVIDPGETRTHIVRTLQSAPPPNRTANKRRPFIDAW